jgi:hypothetical protein
VDRLFEPVELNITNITFTNLTQDLRFVNTYCDNGGYELPFQVVSNGTNWADIIILANVTKGSNVQYSLYHNCTAPGTCANSDYSTFPTMNILEGSEGYYPLINNNYLWNFSVDNTVNNGKRQGEKNFWFQNIRLDIGTNSDSGYSILGVPYMFRNGSISSYNNDFAKLTSSLNNRTNPILQTFSTNATNIDSSGASMTITWKIYSKNDWYEKDFNISVTSPGGSAVGIQPFINTGNGVYNVWNVKNATGWVNTTVTNSIKYTTSDNITVMSNYTSGIPSRFSCIVFKELMPQTSYAWDLGKVTLAEGSIWNITNTTTHTNIVYHMPFIMNTTSVSDYLNKCMNFSLQITYPINYSVGIDQVLPLESTTTTTSSTTTTTPTTTSPLTTSTIPIIFTTTEPCSETNLYLHYKFENNTGDYLYDSSGNNRYGTTYSSPNWVEGKINNALQFNGYSQYFMVSNNNYSVFERTEPFSFSVWVKTNGTEGGFDILTNYNDYVSLSGFSFGNLYGQIGFTLRNNIYTDNYLYVLTNDTNLNDNVFHHVVVSYDGSSTIGGVKIYVDNTLRTIGTEHNTLNDTIVNSNPIYSGISEGSVTYGILDDIRIYNKVLNPSDVSYLYNSGIGTQGVLGGCYIPEEVTSRYCSHDLYLVTNTSYYNSTDNTYRFLTNTTLCEYNCSETIFGTRCNYSPTINSLMMLGFLIIGFGVLVLLLNLIKKVF